MKKISLFILSVIMIFNITVMGSNPKVYAEESDVIWLENDYDEVYSFNNGMARVELFQNDVSYRRPSKYGYINKTGKEVIPLKYDFADDFSEGLARVVLDDKAGYIDKIGKEVIPLKYDWVGDFNEGLAKVVLNEKFGFINKTGKVVIPLKYDKVGDFSEGLAAVQLDFEWSYIDKTGKEVISLKDQDVYTAWDFSEGLARIDKGIGCGYIDKNGEVVIPAIYSSPHYETGLYIDGKMDFKNYESINEFREIGESQFKGGVASVINQDWEAGYIDKNGKVAVPFKSNDGGWNDEFSEGLKGVQNNDKWSYIDKTGKEIISLKYNNRPGDFSEGLAVVSEGDYPNNKYGYIDKTGKEIIPMQFQYATEFSDGLAIVTLQGKRGIIRNPLKFESVQKSIEREFNNRKYQGYKEVYYEYLRMLANETEVPERLGEVKAKVTDINTNAILIDINEDSRPELITRTKYEIEDNFQHYTSIYQYYKLKVISSDGISLEPMYEFSDWIRYNDMYDINLCINKDTGEYFLVEINYTSGQHSGEHINILKLNGNKFDTYKKISFVTTHEYYVDDEVVDEEDWNKKYDEFQKEIEKLTKIELDSFENLNDDKIQDILDEYIDEPITISYDFDDFLSIIGSKKFINLKLSEEDANLTYEIDNTDIAQVTSGGEVIGLKEGTTNIKVVARKSGFEAEEIIIPVTVKPQLNIDFTKVNSSTDSENDIKYLKEIIETSDPIYFEDNETLTEVIKLINFIIKKASRHNVPSSQNMITINDKTVKQAVEEANRTKQEVEKILNAEQVNLQREIATTVRLDGVDIKDNESTIINLDPSLIKTVEEVDFINIGLGETEVNLNVSSLKKEFEETGSLLIEIKLNENKDEEVYEIIFKDENGNVKESLENNITFHLPLNNQDSEYSAVFFNNGQTIEQLGGKYDSIINTINFSTKQTGEYYIVENQKNYDDISHLSQEMQDAIVFMGSKGFITDRGENIFDPDSKITRAEFASFLVRTFYVLDRNLSTTFADVDEEDWYYDYIASSEEEGIINGYPDQTFRGDDIINREQIVSVSARALYEKKKYLYPENLEEYLLFIDSEEISDWAKQEVALAFRETLIDMPKGREFKPKESMTRADAALIVYRLFQLLYETSPSDLGNIEEGQRSNSDIPIIPITSGVVGAGILGGYVFKKRKIGRGA